METLTRTHARREFQKLWVAGAQGVFFTILLRSLAVHLQQVSLTPNWLYTLDLFTRYGYLLWLLIYFFMSNLRIGQSDDKKDLPFDVIQSLLSWTTLVVLDFVVTGYGIPPGQRWWVAVTVANATILIIAILALQWFPDNKLKSIRKTGIALAIASIIVVWLPFSGVVVLLLVTTLELALLTVLLIYVYQRWPTV